MIGDILDFSIGFLFFVLLVLLVYLEFFLISKLHKEICVSGKGVKIPLWKGLQARLQCMKGFATVHPYDKRIKRAFLFKNIGTGIVVLITILAIAHRLMGYEASFCSIKNINKKEIIILKKDPSLKNITGLRVEISGFIEGESNISLMLDNKKYKTSKLNGDFSIIWRDDWYSDTAKIFYQPIDVEDGHVNIRYQFEEI